MRRDRDSIVRSLDEIDLDDLDDFESEDLDLDEADDDDDAAARGRNAYVAGLWAKQGFSAEELDDRDRLVVVAHKMVQNFVDTFSTDGRYRVTFDPTISTAGTDLTGHKIAITPSPLFDKTLTPDQAALILTAMATHEICHPRYGRGTAQAVRRIFGNKRAPNTLSNLLDDVRIERRFAAEYPGYADVFRPMIDYVGRTQSAKSPITASMDDVVNVAILATRYERWVKWPAGDLREERDWWKAWAERGAREDAPRRHVEAVREGLKRVVFAQKRRERNTTKEPTLNLSGDLARIKDSLDGLPPIARKAMRLSSEGRTGAEIAATLGVSLDDARTIIRSARKRMAGLA